VYATGSLSSFSNSNFGAVLCWTDGNNWYKAFIDGASLFIQKKVAGTATILASVPFTATAGTSYTIHFRAVGATLTANVWAASGSEPSGWMCKIRIGKKQGGGLKSGINEVSSTVSKELWRQRGCSATWNDQPFTF
jgi:hypothetical protein